MGNETHRLFTEVMEFQSPRSPSLHICLARVLPTKPALTWALKYGFTPVCPEFMAVFLPRCSATPGLNFWCLFFETGDFYIVLELLDTRTRMVSSSEQSSYFRITGVPPSLVNFWFDFSDSPNRLCTCAGLRPQPPKSWYYRHELPYLVSAV